MAESSAGFNALISSQYVLFCKRFVLIQSNFVLISMNNPRLLIGMGCSNAVKSLFVTNLGVTSCLSHAFTLVRA
jgi:hypothetical protein